MRLFVAVNPSDAVRDELARTIEHGRAVASDAKWQRAEAIHLTLAFLGHVADELAPQIAAALEPVAARHAPLALHTDQVGTFGSKGRPRVLWVGLGGALEALSALQRDVEAALVPLGYQPEERAFRPHLTLARARELRGDPALAAAREALAGAGGAAFTSAELILYESRLSPKGAKYGALARLPLGEQPGVPA